EDGGRRIAVGDARDVHDQLESWPLDEINRSFTCLHFRRKSPQTSTKPRLHARPHKEVRARVLAGEVRAFIRRPKPTRLAAELQPGFGSSRPLAALRGSDKELGV